MAKFCGIVGFSETTETSPGVYDDSITERSYKGDTLKNTKRDENSGNVNDNIVVNNQISIVADEYAFKHFFAIKYVEWMGASWKVTNVEVKSPRLILTFGGVYNG